MKTHLTPREVAVRWRINAQTLANWRSSGRGPDYIKIGAKVLYPLESIIHYETDQCHSTDSSAADWELNPSPVRHETHGGKLEQASAFHRWLRGDIAGDISHV